MAVWTLASPGLAPPRTGRFPIVESDFAWFALQHAGVRSVDIRDCDPDAGHCTFIIDGGSPTDVHNSLRPLTDVALHIRRDCGCRDGWCAYAEDAAVNGCRHL